MSEETREVKKFQDTMYTQSLCGETIYKYKLLGLLGFNLPHPMGARGANLVFQWFGAKSTVRTPRGDCPKQLQLT